MQALRWTSHSTWRRYTTSIGFQQFPDRHMFFRTGAQRWQPLGGGFHQSCSLSWTIYLRIFRLSLRYLATECFWPPGSPPPRLLVRALLLFREFTYIHGIDLPSSSAFEKFSSCVNAKSGSRTVSTTIT